MASQISRLTCAILKAASGCFLVVAMAAHPVGAADGPGSETLEGELYGLINGSRIEAGLNPVSWDSALADVAREHNRDMVERGYFDNDNPEGDGPPERLRRAGFRVTNWAENLSIDSGVTLAHVRDMNVPPGRPSNRANFLNPDFSRIGIAVDQPTERTVLITVELITP